MRNSKLPALALVLVVVVLTACGTSTSGDQQKEDDRLKVVATTGMIADVVRNIGGSRVDVDQLMGAGIDPHLYSATESDVGRLTEAEVIFYNGLNLEARMTDIFEQIGKSRPAVAVAERLPQGQILAETNYNQADPHIWMDVGRWTTVIDAVLETLIEVDPIGADTYIDNAQAYRAELEALDAYVMEQISRIPEQQRLLVTAHDAFQYYSNAYGIEVFAPQGITTESEASVEDIRRVIELMSARRIPAIFVESSVPPDIVEAIVEGAAAAGHEIVIGGQLYSDAMGELGTPEGTYIGMIRHNTDVIVSALLGEI